MSDDMKMYGPYNHAIEVYVTDGEQVGKATVGGAIGKPMLTVDIEESLSKCEAHIKEQMGDNWRLCNKEEFVNEIMAERTGTYTRFSVPGGKEWDRPEDADDE